MVYEKKYQEMRMNEEILKNSNQGYIKNAELYKSEVLSLTEDLELLRRSGGDSQEQLDALRLEYFNFRQEQLEAHTQIRDLTLLWREVSTELEKAQSDLDAKTQEISKLNAANQKLKDRHLQLQQEHRDVAQHVHEYYTTINKLEAELKLEQSTREENSYDLKQLQQ